MIANAVSTIPCKAEKKADPQMEVRIRFLIPEETFTGIEFAGSILRCNERGMLVSIAELPAEFYGKLLSAKRYLRVLLNPNSPAEARKITGLVSWLDFHRKGQRGSLNIGFEYVHALSKGEWVVSAP